MQFSVSDSPSEAWLELEFAQQKIINYKGILHKTALRFIRMRYMYQNSIQCSD